MDSQWAKRAPNTFSVRFFQGLITTIFMLVLMGGSAHSSRLARDVMMFMTSERNTDCTELTITQKNLTSTVILTGTVSSCDAGRAGSYKCTLQIWRAMKGKKLISDLVHELPGISLYKKKYVDVFGLGSSTFCNSDVKDHDTRIFFLNKVNGRLVLSASLLRITLANLENTQAVIEGQHIQEPPMKPRDPCLDVLCGYGARCKAIDGKASCVCPPLNCGEADKFAPVCGSDGITYSNECRMRGAQCMSQRRIRLASERACEPDCEGRDRFSEVCIFSRTTTAPVVDKSSCRDVTCGNSAICQVKVGNDGSRTPTCECPTCDGETADPVCGSDQRTHRSPCEMRRVACIEGREVTVVRNSPCNPCEAFNETTGRIDLSCGGVCSIDSQGQPSCCDDVQCGERPPGNICGSDGKTYESLCAMKRRACMTARNISFIKDGPCPETTPTTLVSGSISIQADENCPGNCDPDSRRFVKFLKKVEKLVNENLQQQNVEDIDQKTLGDFQVTEIRSGSVVLVFKAYASTASQPITLHDAPNHDTKWIYDRLYHPVSGALTEVMSREALSPVEGRDPHDDFVVEDVCLHLTCSHGAMCSLSRSGNSLIPSCSCEEIGDADRLAVTLACKRGSGGSETMSSFINKDAARKEMCSTKTIITFKDVCFETPESLCEGGCQGEGQVCTVTNGEGVCQCLTCGNEYKPVCTTDGQTFRSMCELQRQNCLTGENLVRQSDGLCESQCSDVKCWNGAQCETVAQGAECVCPTYCVETYAPVCGSNCITYDNECKMVVEGCKNKQDITVAYTGTCDSQDHCRDGSGVEEEGSSMQGDECGCKYGATCDDTIDDEDANCICSFSCSSSDSNSQVCGSDGVTYMNECELNSTQCEKQSRIFMAADGPCQATCAGSRYGCCKDGVTAAKGLRQGGCPETCQCNPSGSYGSSCNPTTGQCVCRPGVGGLRCDRCQPGFWNFRSLAEGHISGCMACRCHSDGSRREDCDQMTGKCDCKAGVKGTKCTECESDGTWVTSSACDSTSSSSSLACQGLSCRAGQDCVRDDVTGNYVCRCPDLSSCDEFNGGSVCGTDGTTYPDACQMRVMTCMQGIDVTVAGEGSCQDYVRPLEETPTVRTTVKTTARPPPTVKPSPEPETRPEPEPETHPEPEPETSPLPKPKTSPGPKTSPFPKTSQEPQTSQESKLEPVIHPTLKAVIHPDMETSPETEPNVAPTRNVVPAPGLQTSPEPEPEMSPEPEITPEPEMSPEPEISPEPQPETSAESRPEVTTVVVPEDENESSGSDCEFGDDEDCMGSGDGDGTRTETTKPATTTTTSLRPTTTKLSVSMETVKAQEAVLYKGRGFFKSANGTALPYAADLVYSDSEVFKTYSDVVQAQIMAYASDPSLKQQVRAVSITGFSKYSNWFSLFDSSIYAHFDIHLAPGSMGEEVQRALNSVSSNIHEFTLEAAEQPLPKMTEEPPIINGSKKYVEDENFSIPQFGGASYAEFPLPSAFSSITVNVAFRSFDSEGLLVFAEEGSSKSDFVSLSVHRGRAEFRFNTGSGPLILRSKNFVNDSRWHTLVARRNRRDGMLKLDSNPAVHGTSPRGTSGLNIEKNLFVGGFHRKIKARVVDKVGVTKGLTGCIRSITVQDKDLRFNSSCSSTDCITKSYRLADCVPSPCYHNPCKNAANCRIAILDHSFTAECDCAKGFEGDYCEERESTQPSDPCSSHECHPPSHCLPEPGGDGYRCDCPPGLSGILCMDNATEAIRPASFMPAFAQDSYLKLKPLKGVKTGMAIEVTFYSSHPNGLLFYSGRRGSSQGDLVALNLLDNHLEFLYDLGNGMAKIRSSTFIILNKWHVVAISRNMRMGSISVDNGASDTGSSPKQHSELNIKRPLYLGGIPDFTKVPSTTGITTGLRGALQKFVVNGVTLNITQDPPNKSYNVHPFNAHVCYHTPCKHGGTCHPNLEEYTCSCVQGWYGEHCTDKEPVNKNIQREEAESGVYFDGNTKAMYRNHVKRSRSRSLSHNSYQLQITTSRQHGLLMVVGKATSGGSNLHDYIALAVSKGHVHLRYNLGSGPAHLVSKERVDDGRLATIKVERKGKVASLQVNNGLVQRVESPGRTSQLNTDEYLWIGGIDYKPHGIGLYKSFFEPFVGCVSSLSIHDEPIRLRDDALNTPTLRTCS